MSDQKKFLRVHGWSDAVEEPMTGDASLRRYTRLRRGSQSAILMDMPPPLDITQFLVVDEHLAAAGCSVPAILAIDAEKGLALLEDFGDTSFSSLLDRGHPAECLYRLAVDRLISLHENPNATSPLLPSYDEERFLMEVSLLTDWFIPSVTGRQNTPARQEYRDVWHSLFHKLPPIPQSIVLYDYFPGNLMLLKRDGLAACGLLDFQDARVGAVTYDLISLLEDARRDVSPDLRNAMQERYLESFPQIDRLAFKTSWAIFAAQRHAKVIGGFIRLSVRDGKSGYLQHVPRVWRLLQEACDHPVLADFRSWLDHYIPPADRTIPDGLQP